MPKKVKKQKIQKSVSKSSKNLSKSIEFVPNVEEEVENTSYASGNTEKPKSMPTWAIAIGLLVILIGIYMYKSGKLISATVNGKPIFRWQLTQALVDRFGAQTLEMMITEKLIEDEASKNNVQVTAADIEKRQNEMLARIGGGVSLDDLLKFQGMTKEDFNKQIKIQLSVEKILAKDTKVTDSEINQFIATSSSQLKATTEAQLKEEAKNIILENKIGERISTWYNDLKTKASIKKFL